MTSMKIFQFSRPPTHFAQLRPKFLHPRDIGSPNLNKPLSLPPSPNDNQLIERKHNPRMTIICYQVFVFVFSINSLIFPGFPLSSFHLAEANLLPRAILKKLKTSFSPSSYSVKMCSGQD